MEHLSHTILLRQPTTGAVVTLAQAQVCGDFMGFAMVPQSRTVCAPLAGTVTRLHTGGCIVQGDTGARIAMPLQTRAMSLVRVGEHVTCGQPLLAFAQELPDFLPVVLTNAQEIGCCQVTAM